MFLIRPEFCELYSLFLRDLRTFFQKLNFLEIETPLLTRQVNIEAHIDSFQVYRANVRKSPHAPPWHAKTRDNPDAYLITSPEFALKSLLIQLKRNIYQIAHCFRAGEIGPFHMEEFLLLEWYFINADEFVLMDQCEELLFFMSQRAYSKAFFQGSLKRRSVQSVLKEYANCTWARDDLEQVCLEKDLIRVGDDKLKQSQHIRDVSTTDLFHSVFINLVEPHLGLSGPEFVYHYPPELAAFSRVENGYARRFEIYWNALELANAYYELSQKEEYLSCFKRENAIRQKTAQESPAVNIQIDEDFIKLLEQNNGLPEASGIALGLDRLFLILLGEKSFHTVYNLSAYE